MLSLSLCRFPPASPVSPHRPETCPLSSQESLNCLDVSVLVNVWVFFCSSSVMAPDSRKTLISNRWQLKENVNNVITPRYWHTILTNNAIPYYCPSPLHILPLKNNYSSNWQIVFICLKSCRVFNLACVSCLGWQFLSCRLESRRGGGWGWGGQKW